MRPAQLNHPIYTDNFTRAGPAIRDRVHARTEELAVIAGRAPHDVSLEDYAQAKRELTGQADSALQDAIIDAPNETGRMHDESCPTAERPLLSDNGLGHRVETFQAADVGAIAIERNRLPYRRMFS